MVSLVPVRVSPYVLINSDFKPKFSVRVQSLGDSDSTVLSSDLIKVNGNPFLGRKEKNAERRESKVLIEGGNGRLKSGTQRKWVNDPISNYLEVLWDDGYGTKTVKDYLEGAREIIKPDGGPPRWFSPVECGQPLKNSPVLLFLPGLDGVGLGLTLHHKALGKVFEVWCLHIPVYDRTPFEGLVKLVQETVRVEHASSPNKPIYLVGDSFGGCLALAVAARNPKIDLVVILVNPATSFGRSPLQPFFPLLEALPKELHNAVPYLLSGVMGNPGKMAMADIEYRLPPRLKFDKFSANLTGFLPHLAGLSDIIPKETLLWKLKLLNSASDYANSRLHAVKAEVLLLVSGDDYMLPSKDEAERLKKSLQNIVVRRFDDNGHTLLLEENLSLLCVIKGTGKYRRSRKFDFVSDFVPPSMSEFKYCFDQVVGSVRSVCSSATFSTLADGTIVRGLDGVPNEGPVLYVGYHMLMGVEIYSFVEEFLRQKKILVHGVAHPLIFNGRLKNSSNNFAFADWMQVMGAVPVAPSNLYKLLATKSHVLLYPGGAREALHYKGEEYKLIWPDQQEFVRMAAKFGATIVPFGSVGEDDILNLALDYNDLMRIPILNDYIRESSLNSTRVRDRSEGEVGNGELFIPGLLPKVPGRIYFLFGKPIETKGKEELLEDKDCANEMYLQVKSEVGRNIDYLLKKREEDPYRNIFDRIFYRLLLSSACDVPAFDP